MSLKRHLPFVLAATIAGGCAAKNSTPPTLTKVGGPGLVLATTRASELKANLTLDQIQPAVTLPLPTTQPTDQPPLDAIALYAKAVDELLLNRRFTAINDLEKAVTLDPNSADLRQTLGRAYLGTANFNDQSIAALQKAVAIEPDNLEFQLQLGRQFFFKGDLPNAITSLRRAMLTTDYTKGDDQAALTDFFLAYALQNAGYDRASLDRFQTLLDRIKSPGPALRGNPELYSLIARPDLIYLKMAGLYEKNGRYEEALAACQAAAVNDPENFELQSRIVHLMTALRRPEARAVAAQLVKDYSAQPDSIALLRETYRAFGNEIGAADVLRKMLAKDPGNRQLLFALCNTLQQLGKTPEARDLLEKAARQNHLPVEMLSRLQRLYEADGAWQKTALLLLEASQQQPENVGRLAPLWVRLTRSTARQRVRISDISALTVPKEEQAAKLFWISTLADFNNRDGLAKSSLEQSIELSPPYVPAFRLALGSALQDGDDSPAVKSVLDRAAADPALSAELHGMVLLQQKKPAEAETALRRAVELGAHSPDLQDELVDAVLRQNQDDKAEQLLLGIVKDWPSFEPAYLQLVGFYSSRGKDAQTIKTLDSWVTNDPSSTTARLLQARFLLETRHPDAAEQLIDQLLAEESDNAEVLASIQGLYAMQGRLDALAGKLTAMYVKEPQNRDLLDRLVSVELANHKPSEAMRLVDEARIKYVGDADGLYLVANLYQRLNQPQAAEDSLIAALKIDPKHAAASNDLGYNWVDKGKNLDQAEALVRTAVAAEPDNQAFLDSLGWVLYKRGQFAEAVRYLEQASEGSRPDPIVLDHLGDALYRADRKADALVEWNKADNRLSKMNALRDDLKELRLQLNSKLKQMKDGNPVTVAPVIDPTTPNGQAKSN